MRWGELPQIRVNFLFLAVVTLLLLTDRQGVAAHTLAASLFHECGHLLLLACFGVRPREIALCAHGIRCSLPGGQRLSYRQEGAVLLAGPAVNLLLAALLWAFGGPHAFYALLANLVTGCFNLLPCRPLDGGRLLALWAGRKNSPFLLRFVSLLSGFCSAGLLALGGFLLLCGGNFALLLTALVLAVEALAQSWN